MARVVQRALLGVRMLGAIRFFVLFLLFSVFVGAQAKTDSSIYLSYEERILAAYLLLASGESPEVQSQIIHRASHYGLKIREFQKIQVQSFQEFLQIHRGNWPDAHSLEANLEIIENRSVRMIPVIVSDIPDVQMQIDDYLKRKSKFLSQKMKKIEPYFQKYQTGDFQGLQKAFSSESALFLQEQFQKISILGKELLNRQGNQQQSDAFNVFIAFALSEYFQNLSLNSQKQIISQILGEDLLASPLKKFEIMVMNSGPQFQKLLQVVAREATLPKNMVDIFKKLESLTMPVPDYFVKKMIEREANNFEFLEFESKPIGVGTMAQVHAAFLKTEKGPQKVVVRLIKPEIEKRIQEDHNILLRLAPILDANPEIMKAGFAKITPLAEDLTQNAREELDLLRTVDNQKKGRLAYNRRIYLKTVDRDLLVRVPRIFDPKNKNSEFIVQEYVHGFKLDQMQELHRLDLPTLKKELTIELTKLWVEVLLFESGFFHSDLHQGNVTFDFGRQILPMNILDFGMAGQLTERERKYFLILAVASEMNSPGMMTAALMGISNLERNEINKSEFEERVIQKMSDLDRKNMILSPERWIAWALNQGIRFSSQIIGVSRGFTILDKLLKEAQAGTTVLELSRSLAKKHKWQILDALSKVETMQLSDYMRMGRRALQGRRPVDKSPFEAVPLLAPMCRSVLLAK